jgi:TPR repeat protein
VAQSYVEAVRLYRMAAAQGYATAVNALESLHRKLAIQSQSA